VLRPWDNYYLLIEGSIFAAGNVFCFFFVFALFSLLAPFKALIISIACALGWLGLVMVQVSVG
jgi:hypothetical protein